MGLLNEYWKELVTFAVGGGAVMFFKEIRNWRNNGKLADAEAKKCEIEVNKMNTDALQESNMHWIARAEKWRTQATELEEELLKNSDRMIKVTHENINLRTELVEIKNTNKENQKKLESLKVQLEKNIEYGKKETKEKEEALKHACYKDDCQERQTQNCNEKK